MRSLAQALKLWPFVGLDVWPVPLEPAKLDAGWIWKGRSMFYVVRSEHVGSAAVNVYTPILSLTVAQGRAVNRV